MPLQQLREITQPILGPQDQQLRFMQGSEELPVVAIAASSEKGPERAFEDDEQVLDIREEYYKFQEERLAKEAARRQQGTLEEWGAALQTTGTAGLVRAGFNWMERGDADPNFKLTSDELNELARSYELQLDDHTTKRLASASSMEHAHQMARDMQEVQLIQWKLDNAGVKSFLAQVLDPVDNALMFGAAAITGGPGGAAVGAYRAAKLAGASTRSATWTARTVHGGGQAAAAVGGLQAFEATGMETTMADYILSLGLGTVVGVLTMPRRHLDEAFGSVNVRPDGTVEIKPGKADAIEVPAEAGRRTDVRTGTAGTTAVTEAPRSYKRVRVAAEETWSAPELVRRVRKEVQEVAPALEAPLRRLESGMQALSKAGVKLRASDLTTPSVHSSVAKALQVVSQLATGKQARNLPKAFRQPLQELQEHAAAVNQTVEELVEETLLRFRNGEEVAVEIKEALAKVTGTEVDDLAEVLKHQAADGSFRFPEAEAPAVAAAKAPGTKQADAAELLDASTDPSVEAPVSPVEAALEAAGPVQEGGAKTLANAPLRAAAATNKALREFLSDYEKLTGGYEAVRNFMARIVDDPLGRFTHVRNASSQLRLNQNMANRELAVWDDALRDVTLKEMGTTWAQTGWGYSTKYLRKRGDIERRVLEAQAERNWHKLQGKTDAEVDAITASMPEDIKRLVKIMENEVHAKSADRARQQGLDGFEGDMSPVGYFTRIWEYGSMLRVDRQFGDGTSRALIEEAIRRGMPDAPALEIKAIAKAVYDRAKANSTGARSDYMGQLGKVETENILDLLKMTDTDESIIEAVSRRLEQSVDEKGAIKYSKERIPMDMRTSMTMPDGTEVKLLDLLNNNLSGNMEMYQRSMAGRSALASIGVGGGVHGVDTLRTHYRNLLDRVGVPQHQAEQMQRQFDSILGDFTGVKPDADTLNPAVAGLKDLSAATLLSGAGLWQVGETGLITARKGGFNSMRYMLKNFPGIKQALSAIGHNNKLYEELEFVTGLNFELDTRMRPFLRQFEIDLGQSTNWRKYTHSARELSSTLNGMRWVHGMQARMLTNLNILDMWKAANGNKRALHEALSNGATPELLEAVRRVSVVKNGALKGAGLEGLTHAELQDYMHVLTRMQDSALLQHRAGWGSSFQRSAVGQLLGQFTSYVSMAHNRVLRGTYHDKGAVGVAAVLAYSLPWTLMATYLQEARKGNVLDLDNDDDLTELVLGGLKYAPVAGWSAEIVSVVSGNYSTQGVAAMNILQMPGQVHRAFGAFADGDAATAAAGGLKAAAALTVLGAFPGTRALSAALEGDYDD